MSEQTPQAAQEISCSNCGAPIAYLEGESVLSCAYCGSSSMLAGFDKIVRVESHYVLAARLGREEARQSVRSWMKKGWFKAADLAEKAQFDRLEGIVLPFWVVKARAHTFWSGMNRRTRTTGSGESQRSETYWEPTSGDFFAEYDWSVYAREDPNEFWGIDALNPGGRSQHADWGKFFLGFGMGSKHSAESNLLQGAEPFGLEKVPGMLVVNGQITQERAESKGRDQIVGHHRKLVEGKASRITDCDTTVDITKVDLVYLPLWGVGYTYHNRPYRVLVHGHTGSVITGEAPVGKWDKVMVLGIIMAVLAALFSLIAHLGEIPALWIGTGVCGGIVTLHALWTALFSKG